MTRPPPQAVNPDGDCFLAASVGPGAGEATLIGPRIVRDVAGVSDEDSAFGEPPYFGVWKDSISRLVPALLAASYARHIGQQGWVGLFPPAARVKATLFSFNPPQKCGEDLPVVAGELWAVSCFRGLAGAAVCRSGGADHLLVPGQLKVCVPGWRDPTPIADIPSLPSGSALPEAACSLRSRVLNSWYWLATEHNRM